MTITQFSPMSSLHTYTRDDDDDRRAYKKCLLIFHVYCVDPTYCTGNGIYSNFRNNRNFWLEYSTPPTTRYPEYEEDFFDDYSASSVQPASSTSPPGPHFLTANHSRLQSPVGATTFLHCQVDDLKDLQVRCIILPRFLASICILHKAIRVHCES